MAKERSVAYATTGHREILASVERRHRLALGRTFTSSHTVCAQATTPAGEAVFVKIKGYTSNPSNRGRFRRAAVSNRLAAEAVGDIMPRVLEFRAFERDDVLWLVMLSRYGGEPLSRGLFFDGDGADIGDATLAGIRRALDAIPIAPSASLFYDPQRIAASIRETFGGRAPGAAAHWTSAHCDFHWGNLLAGARQVIDWDMFSLAPRGFDAASILLFSVSDRGLFERLHLALADLLANDSARVAILFAAARILRMMRLDAFAAMRPHEAALRDAVGILTQTGRD